MTIVRACLFLGISRQAYYKRNRVADERHAQGLQVVRFVRQVRLRQPRVGTRKLHYLLQGQDDGGLKVGRDRLFQILLLKTGERDCERSVATGSPSRLRFGYS